MDKSPLLFKEPWAELIGELVDQGSDAVPELIAELDQSDDDRMLRCLGFTLRALGDYELNPIGLRKGRRFGMNGLVPIENGE